MNAPGIYKGWGHKKYISQKEIEHMKKNMKKVPIISLKSDIYHKKEIQEAEHILEEIPQIKTEQENTSENNNNTHNKNYKKWRISKIRSLREHFISLF